MLEHDQRPYRAAQIRKWLFEKRAAAWEQMTDLPRELREQLASEFDIWSAEIAIHRKDDDGTEKLLLTLADGRPQQVLECRSRPEHEAVETEISRLHCGRRPKVPCRSNACCFATTKAIAACASARKSAVR